MKAFVSGGEGMEVGKAYWPRENEQTKKRQTVGWWDGGLLALAA